MEPPPLARPPVVTPRLIQPRSVTQFDRDLDIIESPPPSGTGGGSTGPFPFDASSTGSGTLTVTIRPGTLNGLLPTNFTSTFSISDTGVYYVVLSATATDGEIASCALSIVGTAPAGVPTLQGQPPTAFDYLLGVIVDGVWFRTIGNGSLAAAGSEVFRVSKTSPAPGTLPYDIYYTWVITAV